MSAIARSMLLDLTNRTKTLVGFMDVIADGASEVQANIEEVLRAAQPDAPDSAFGDALEALLQTWTIAAMTSFIEMCKDADADLRPLFLLHDPDHEPDEDEDEGE